MNIKELSNLNGNVAVTITLSDLREFFDETVAKYVDKPQQEPETFLSVDETCKLLHVSANTLWRWDKNDYLKPSKVGRTSVYKMSDIKQLLKS